MAIKRISYKEANFRISYVLHGDAPRGILFLHGWGSNKEVMLAAFKDRFRDFSACFVDLPGFGASSNSIALDTRDYAEIMFLFLHSIDFRADFIAGHSFGGKVASLLAQKVHSDIILLSSAGILERKSLWIKSKILLAKFAKKIGFKFKIFASSDARSLDCAMYETFKNVVDEDFSLVFLNFKNRAFIFWGRDDRATSLESGRKIAHLIQTSHFHVLEGDHYFFLKHSAQIERLFKKDLES